MNFFDIATEIRLKIYSELLVLSEPIVFLAYRSPSLFRSQRERLYPALLRANRRVHREASPLLYSNNRFQFPEVFTFTFAPTATSNVHIAPFLYQIQSQASLIRHICIPLHIFDYPQFSGVRFHKAHIKILELIRDTCTSIKTLELLVSPDYDNYPLGDSETLDLLDTRFKSIPSLKEIIVNFKVYPEQDPSDDLTKKVHDYGWTVSVTKLPKKTRVSLDGRVEFDNEEDWWAYDDEVFFIME